MFWTGVLVFIGLITESFAGAKYCLPLCPSECHSPLRKNETSANFDVMAALSGVWQLFRFLSSLQVRTAYYFRNGVHILNAINHLGSADTLGTHFPPEFCRPSSEFVVRSDNGGLSLIHFQTPVSFYPPHSIYHVSVVLIDTYRPSY